MGKDLDNIEFECDDCGMIWTVPSLNADGTDYNGEDLYKCPQCHSKSFGEHK